MNESQSSRMMPLHKVTVISALGILLLAIASEYCGFDLWLESHFYDSINGWVYRDNWYLEKIFHRGGQFLIASIGFFLLVIYTSSFFSSSLRVYRKSVLLAFFSSLTCILLVAWMKRSTHIFSPWDLAIFGGEMPYVKIFDHVPMGIRAGHAFPAGHSSGAFAWTSLFFLTSYHKILHPKLVLVGVLLLGFVFGMTQQFRGAHFFSHDLFSLATCLIVNLLFFSSFSYNRQNALSEVGGKAIPDA